MFFRIQMIGMSGNIIECPPNLRTGVDIIVSLRVFLLPGAFKKASAPDSHNGHIFLREGQESIDEHALRERKTALLSMFKMLGLEAKTTAPALERTASEAKQKGKGKGKTEIVGEGSDQEEVEVEGEELSEKDLSLIYRKSVPVSMEIRRL